MNCSRHCLRPARPLVSSLKTKQCQFSFIDLYATLYLIPLNANAIIVLNVFVAFNIDRRFAVEQKPEQSRGHAAESTTIIKRR